MKITLGLHFTKDSQLQTFPATVFAICLLFTPVLLSEHIITRSLLFCDCTFYLLRN